MAGDNIQKTEDEVDAYIKKNRSPRSRPER